MFWLDNSYHIIIDTSYPYMPCIVTYHRMSLIVLSFIMSLHPARHCSARYSIYIYNIPMDWKSDPLGRAGGPSLKATPQKPRREIFLGVALRYR